MPTDDSTIARGRHPVAAAAVRLGAAGLAAISLLTMAYAADDNDDAATAAPAVVVSASPPAAGEAPSPEFIAEVRAASERGGRLYDERRYDEALPYLLAAAERGFKLPQASAADIYLHGRGGVERNVLLGVGWLGVAAAPTTSRRIADYYDRVREQLPETHVELADRVVAEFRSSYGAPVHRVECRTFGYIVEDIGCRFTDDPEPDLRFERDVIDPDVEEVIVTAPIIQAFEPELGEIPSGEFISDIYDARNQGTRLYNEGRFREALPFLVAAAKRGFKWAQASAADIYLNGRGGVPPDLEAGIGWLGVAAQPKSSGAITRYFKDSVTRLPQRFTPDVVDRIVADYNGRYGNLTHRVACRYQADEGASWSLYLKRLRCHFIDEATQCRNLAFDGTEVNSQWTCAPVEGTRSLDARPY